MNLTGTLIAFISGVFLCIAILYPRIRGIRKELEALRKEKENIREFVIRSGAGLNVYNLDVKKQKQVKLSSVLSYLSKHPYITCRDTEKLLGVSSATATRYLQELKAEGKVVERGKGRSVHYKLP